MLLLLGSVVCGFFLILLLMDKRSKRGEVVDGKVFTKVPPCPPLIGHMFELGPKDFLQSLQKWNQLCGSFYDVFVFNKRMRVVGEPTIARELMQKRPKTFRRGRRMQVSFEFLGFGAGLTIAEGESWSRLRRISAPQFSKLNIIALWNIMIEEVNLFANRLPADGSTVVDMDIWCTSFTSRTIGRLALGIKLEDMNEYFGTDLLVHDLETFVDYLIEHLFYPFPDWTWKYTSLYNLELKARAANKRLDDACCQHIQVIRDRLRNKDHVKEGGNPSLIECLIINEDNSVISDADCILNVKTILGAGADTTGIVTTWIMYFMAVHADIRERVRQEVVGVLTAANRTELTFDDIAKLPLLNAVVKEAIRLRSPAAVNLLELNDGVPSITLSNGMVIREDDQVCIDYDACFQDESVFPEPDKFLPDRWLTTDSEKLKTMEHSFIAFGSGPRVCPGMALSLNEAALFLAGLVRKFDWRLGCDSSEIKRVMKFTAKANKMPIIFSKREE